MFHFLHFSFCFAGFLRVATVFVKDCGESPVFGVVEDLVEALFGAGLLGGPVRRGGWLGVVGRSRVRGEVLAARRGGSGSGTATF